MHHIRAAQLDDLGGIFSIYDREVLSGICTFETVVKTAEGRREWFEAHPAGVHPLIVAVEADGAGEERVVGWAGLSKWSPRAAYARTAEHSVYIAEDARGRGLGRKLMEELIARTRRDTGVKVIVARIVQPNEASNVLHESLGFERIGLMRGCGEKFGRVLDVLLMDLRV